MKEKKNQTFSSSSLSMAMESKPSEELVEEREELMVNLSSYRKNSHLLKPCSTSISIDGSEAVLPRRKHSFSSSPEFKALSLSVRFTGWRFASENFCSWVKKMADLHEPIWRKAGIFEAVMASTARIYKDIDLVLSVAERWCPNTNTFVFPWGEATITLEDVMVLLGFSVLGSPVFAALDSEGDKVKSKLDMEWSKILNSNFVTQVAWMERFMGCGDELEHVAFLALWLCYFVFPSRYFHIYKGVFPIAVHISRGTRIALAPAVLAHLYADLRMLKAHIRDFAISKNIEKIYMSALFKLVQVWSWERFKELQPRLPNPLIKGELRLALWHDIKHKTKRVRWILDNSKIDSFEWRPYTKNVEEWEFPKFYPEKAMFVPVGPNLDDEFVSYARCIKVSELVGIGCVEHYFPDRVASQFGIIQDVPGTIKRNNLSQKAAWDDFSKPIDDLTLYIPSRSATARDTQMFREWRRRSLSELKYSSEENLVVETDETLRLRGLKRVHGDDENSSVPSSSKMKRTSENVRKIAWTFINKRRKFMKLARDKRRKNMKRARENDESAIGCCQKQIAIDSDKDEDTFTISQLVSLGKKKYSNVTNSGEDSCERFREKRSLEQDINDSGPRLKLASRRADGDETIRPPEKEKRHEGTSETGSQAGNNMVMSLTDENHSSDPPLGFDEAIEIVMSPPETRQTCEDELTVSGSNCNAEKMTMIDDSSKEPEYLLYEEDAIAREKARSDEKDDDAVGLIQRKLATEELASKAHIKELTPRRKLANGDETAKAYKRSEDVGLSYESSYQKRLRNLQEMSDSIEKSIEEAKRNVAWLKKQQAIRHRNLRAARMI